MAASVKGLTKKTDTEVTASDITTSDVALISDKVEKLVDQIQKALKFNNNSEKDKKELNATLKDILKQREQIQEYQETREKLLKRSKNLTKEQREAILEDLDEEALKIFKNFSSLDEELKGTSLIMASKLGVGKNFNKTFTEILETTKQIEKTAQANQKIRDRNEAIDSARKKVGETIGGGLVDSVETLFYNSLGPLRIFTDPLFGGKKGFFSAFSTLTTAFGKKVNSSSKTELLSKGGTIGKSAVLIADTIEKASNQNGEEGGFFGDIFDNIGNGIATALGIKAGSGLEDVFTSGLKSVFSLKALGIGALGTLVAFTAYSTFTDKMGEVFENAMNTAEEMSPSDIDVNNSGSVSIVELNDAINRAIKENRTFASWFDLAETTEERIKARQDIGNILLGKLSEDVLARSQSAVEWLNNTAGVLTPDSPEVNWKGGIYQYTDPLGMTQGYYVPAGQDPQAWVENYLDKMVGITSLRGDALIQLQLTDMYTEAELASLLQKELASKEPDEDYIRNLNGALYAERAGLLYSPLSSTIGLNDAIIYKDNSVYVPHPEDNIILTKDDVSTPALTADFETTLFNILNKIAEKSKGGTVVNNFASNSSFDFSALRI